MGDGNGLVMQPERRRRDRQIFKGNLERAIGIEPTTFSLGS
jgi:hypothetical protein